MEIYCQADNMSWKNLVLIYYLDLVTTEAYRKEYLQFLLISIEGV